MIHSVIWRYYMEEGNLIWFMFWIAIGLWLAFFAYPRLNKKY